MVKYLVLILFSIDSSFILSQNLVLNPSFECATDVCDRDDDGSQFHNHVCNWYASSSGTPDLFSTVAQPGCFTRQPHTDPPWDEDQPGSQMPHSGMRFAGIFTYGCRAGDPPEYREYLSAILAQPLSVGSYYMVSMYVSRAPNMIYASNNLGVYFAVTPYEDYASDYPLTQYQPQVIDSTIIVTTEWTKICKTFKATSPATTINIGNFSYDESTKAINIQETAVDPYYYNAYYFIDDVSVEKISSPDSLNIIVNGSMAICLNQSTPLEVLPLFDSVAWTIFPDTLHVISYSNIFQAEPQTTTTYSIKAELCDLTFHDTVTVRVNPIPKVSLGNDTTLCVGSSKVLTVENTFSSYLWQDNSALNNQTVTTPGTYSVTVKNQYGCAGNSSINIGYLAPPKVNLGRDTLVCLSFAPLNASNKGSSYLWSSGSIDSIFTPTKAGKYWVTVQNQCGISSDSVQVSSLSDIDYPNVLTLNDDGKNEKFKILGVEDAKGSIQIFNRWGQIIFNDFEYRNNWPLNNDIPSGEYFFDLHYPRCPQNYKGWIQVFK